jgi:hypothetical protein
MEESCEGMVKKNYSRGKLYEVPFATLLKGAIESGTKP